MLPEISPTLRVGESMPGVDESIAARAVRLA